MEQGIIGEDEIIIVLISTSKILAMRTQAPILENAIFVINNEQQYKDLTANYVPNEDYLFLDTSFTKIHEANTFIQKRFCKLSNARMENDVFSPGIV